MNKSTKDLQRRERLKKWASDMSSKRPDVRRRAANGLYKALYEPLKFYFLKKLGNRDGSNCHEDLTLVAIEKVFENIGQYNSNLGEFNTWAYRIALNVLIDDRRKFKGRDVVSVEAINAYRAETDNDSPFELPELGDDQLKMLMHYERQDYIIGVIQRMQNKKDAAVLILRFYGNLSYEEIVEEMGMPMGTVKARINRAKEKLSQLLSPDLMLAE